MGNIIEQLGFGQPFRIKSNLKVDELMNHDMIYIYHHLRIGDVVELKKTGTDLKGNPIYDVCYKNFKLGVCRIDGVFKSFYENEDTVYASISGLSKTKYRPISALDIQIGVESMKKAV
jgi:hypothetical protein